MINPEHLKQFARLDNCFRYINQKFPLYQKAYDYILENFDTDYMEASEELLEIIERRYPTQEQFNQGLDALIYISREFTLLQARLNATGKYENSSYDYCNQNIYQNKDLIHSYMDGLLFSYVFWPNHYKFLLYFKDLLRKMDAGARALDVPVGNAVYSYHILKYLRAKELHCIDISASCVQYAADFLKATQQPLKHVTFSTQDILSYCSDQRYDFISCGELLEHLEDPRQLLKVIHGILQDKGKVFLTTAIWTAAIDHIYLFKSVDDVRRLIDPTFTILSELIIPVSLKPYQAGMKNEAINYACVLAKK